MTRRWTLLTAALVMALSLPQAAGAVTPAAVRAAPTATSDDEATVALGRLRADADGGLRVQRDGQGEVSLVSSTDGRAMVESTSASPRRAAQTQLERYGEAFGIDGQDSAARVTEVLESSTGGSVVRADQVVDGVPVFGGQVVLSLDEDQGVVSVNADTTDATEVPAPVVRESEARRTALAVAAKAHQVSQQDLTATGVGRRLFDPTVVHVEDRSGVRPAWQFEVTGAPGVRETVLVGTGRGEVVLHFNNAPALSRRVCDNANAQDVSSTDPEGIPICPIPARVEAGPAAGSDTDAAYANLGAASDAYAALGNIDLTDLVGATVAGEKRLQATVRWCFTDEACPYDNALWDGRQMVFGEGYAAADDVVGHELTHGYVERTSGLFPLHQSGALNESVSDVIGEIVDHRNAATPDSDADWTIGEDLPAPELRSLKDPTLHDQPDRMTSELFDDADLYDDNGAVHANGGVGNKTAYLVSQGTAALPGGTFNSQTIPVGIDDGDPGLARTGRLWLETIKRLTSGSEYADFGTLLGSTCDELVGAASGGFTAEHCLVVRQATLATELDQLPADPAAAAPEAPVSCPAGTTTAVLRRDDDNRADLGLSLGSLWQRTPANDTLVWSRSGKSSLFGFSPEPDPWGDPPYSAATTAPFLVPTGVGRTALNFQHAHLFEWYDSKHPTNPTLPGQERYFDGARVDIQQRNANGTWSNVGSLPWTNGPDKAIEGFGPGWGGDSHGYGSSEVDLSSLAGKTVRALFYVLGDVDVSVAGWWVDDIRVYACGDGVPGAPTITRSSAGATSAAVYWSAPYYPGEGVTGYRITRSDGRIQTVSANARSVGLTGVNPATQLNVTVAATYGANQVGPGAVSRFYPSTTRVTSSTLRARKNQLFTVTGTVVRRTTGARVAGLPVTLQRRVSGQARWTAVARGTTSAQGTRAWRVRLTKATSYRVVTSSAGITFGSTSAAKLVRKR